MKFTEKQLNQLAQKGISPDEIKQQLETYAKGFPFVKLQSSCTANQGVLVIPTEIQQVYCEYYDKRIHKLSSIKFTPASGAATRMFKALYEFIESGKLNIEQNTFFNRVNEFALSTDLLSSMRTNRSDKSFAEKLLMDYGNLPKALLPFHKYSDGEIRTAMEEHFAEACDFLGKNIRLHFTISPEHTEACKSLSDKLIKKYEAKYNVSIKVDFSYQNESTDSIAVDLENNPLVIDGEFIFRPSGHGALMDNLNALDADLIFIKNIDNVALEHVNKQNIVTKKMMAGLALFLKGHVDFFLNVLEVKGLDALLNEQLLSFCKAYLGQNLENNKFDKEQWYTFLNRPLRVCGMVKNEGEPGGGPFWVEESEGVFTAQIVESAQVDKSIAKQKDIWTSSTHFNPVDMVCICKNHHLQKYDLADFVNPQTAFIVEKSFQGKSIKLLEKPGLWNGSMANWLSVFVEVPVQSFNPVKSITDLLRQGHNANF
jgi:hypothetical protein